MNYLYSDIMSGELDRINPTIVEGAEDIFGAEVVAQRPGSWGKRSNSGKTTLTHKQVERLQRHLNMRKGQMKAKGFKGEGCGCGGGDCMCAENMNAQGYNSKLDESMGMREGEASTMRQTMKSRRDESKGMERSMGNRAYSGVRTMDAESFNAQEMPPESEGNAVDLGSVDAVFGGGVRVAVSGDNITPTDNPSINEAFNVGNDVGIDVTERELMNVNPSVDFNYGAEGKDIIGTVQDLTGKVGFRINGWVASAVVVGIASMAGYKYAKR